jgi:hypothetical protein
MVGGHHRRALGEAIALEQRKAQIDESPEDVDRQRRGSGDQETQAVEPGLPA